MAVSIDVQDSRYNTLKKSRIFDGRLRPTTLFTRLNFVKVLTKWLWRCSASLVPDDAPQFGVGSHLYEDLVVNNPGGSILDLSLFTAPHLQAEGPLSNQPR